MKIRNEIFLKADLKSNLQKHKEITEIFLKISLCKKTSNKNPNETQNILTDAYTFDKVSIGSLKSASVIQDSNTSSSNLYTESLFGSSATKN